MEQRPCWLSVTFKSTFTEPVSIIIMVCEYESRSGSTHLQREGGKVAFIVSTVRWNIGNVIDVMDWVYSFEI